MFLMYKDTFFVREGNHLNAYRNGEQIAYTSISDKMTLGDVVEVIDELLEM